MRGKTAIAFLAFLAFGLLFVLLAGCGDDSPGGNETGAPAIDGASAAGGSTANAGTGTGGASSDAGGSSGGATAGASGENGAGGNGGSESPDGGAPDAASADGAPADGADPGSGDTYLPWAGGAEYYAQWSAGPPSGQDFFPIAVWLQSPSRADEYAAIGINLFIGLWQGPTDAQLSDLTAAGMNTICEQQGVWSSHIGDDIIWAWMHQDEPDNAQPDGSGGYGPCIPASEIISGYDSMKANDGTRPVYLNLGQGVANDDWVGRGSCTGTSDYPDYALGADILSFDVYPVNSDLPLWYVAQGVSRLRQWANYEKPVWNWIETTGYNDPQGRPTPAQVRSEVWMALVHGSMGIGYFVHVFEPSFIEAGLLADDEMRSAVAEINAQVTDLAPILNTPSIANAVTVDNPNPDLPVDIMVKRSPGTLHIFAVAMRDSPTTATFSIRDIDSATVEVLGESRTLALSAGRFQDAFDPYAVHLYKVTP